MMISQVPKNGGLNQSDAGLGVRNQGFVRAKSLAEAVLTLSEPGFSVLAGGTDWFAGPARTTGLVDISQIAQLRAIEVLADRVRIGAAATWTEILKFETSGHLLGLQAAAREVGGIQIQNIGTLGGNLCNASPAADGVPPLLAGGALVRLIDSQMQIRELPLAEFILGPRKTTLKRDEILLSVDLPFRQNLQTTSAFMKLGGRRYLVISMAMVGAQISCDPSGVIVAAGIAIGSCSPVARRLAGVEQRLLGLKLSDLMHPDRYGAIGADDLAALSPIDDIRADAHYRYEVVPVLVQRVLAQLATRAFLLSTAP